MRTFPIVERNVVAQAVVGGAGRVVFVQVDLLILDAAPEALREDVVHAAAPRSGPARPC